MPSPRLDPPLDLLQEKYQLVGGAIYEKLHYEGQVALFLPKTFLRSEYVTLYLSKGWLFAYHRAVWMLSNDMQIPSNEHGELYLVDHFDGDTMNNKPWNLRLATPLENRRNLGHKVFFRKSGLY